MILIRRMMRERSRITSKMRSENLRFGEIAITCSTPHSRFWHVPLVDMYPTDKLVRRHYSDDGRRQLSSKTHDDDKIEQRLIELIHSADEQWDYGTVEEASGMIRDLTFKRTPEALGHAFRLYDRILEKMRMRPELEDSVHYWKEGNQPRAIHLLNAILDSWRIVGRQSRRILLSPRQMIERPYLFDCRSYTIIMAVAVEQSDDALVLCDDIIHRMLVQGEKDQRALPDATTFNTVLNAWAQSQHPDAPKYAVSLFREMVALHDERVINASPTTQTYNAVLDILGKARSYEAMEKADEILREMFYSPYSDAVPDTQSFRLVILGWLELDDEYALQRAYAVFQEMIQLYEAGTQFIDLNESVYSKLISILARNKGNLKLAEKIYQDLVNLFQRTGDSRLAPGPLTKRAMIIVYAKSGRPKLAESLLYELEDMAQTRNDSSLLPALSHYRDVIGAWFCSGDNAGMDQAEHLLLRMIEKAYDKRMPIFPDRSLINHVIHCWSRSERKDAADRTESLLRAFHQLYKHTSRSEFALGPSSYLYAINAWAFSNRPECAERAEALLYDMYRRYNSGETSLRPSYHHYAAAIIAWGRSGRTDAAQSIEDLFEDYKSSYDGDIVGFALYRAAVQGYCEISEPIKAQHVLEEMVDDYRTGNMQARPSAKLFSLVLSLFMKSNSMESQDRAHSLLTWIKALVDEKILDMDDDFDYSLLFESIYETLGEISQEKKSSSKHLRKKRS